MKRSLLLLLVFGAFTLYGNAPPCKVALFGRTEAAKNQLDLFLAETAESEEIVFLERRQVDALLREQNFATTAWGRDTILRTGRLLHADLLVDLREPEPGQFDAACFDLRHGVLLSSEMLKEPLGQWLARVMKRRQGVEHLRGITLLSIRNIDLPANRLTPCIEVLKKGMRQLSQLDSRIILHDTRYMGQVSREWRLAGFRTNLLLSHAVLFADFYRTNSPDSYLLELTVRGTGDIEKKIHLRGRFGEPPPDADLQRVTDFIAALPADQLPDPRKMADLCFAHYSADRQKKTLPLHLLLPIYDAAVAYDPERYLNPAYRLAIQNAAEQIMLLQKTDKTNLELARTQLDLLEYYLEIHSYLKQEPYSYGVPCVSPHILKYWILYPGVEIVPEAAIPPELTKRATRLHFQLTGMIMNFLSQPSPGDVAFFHLSGQQMLYPALSEQEYYDRVERLMSYCLNHAEQDGTLDWKSIWNAIQSHIGFARRENKRRLDFWHSLALRFSRGRCPEIRLWGLVIRNELGDYETKAAFHAAIAKELTTVPASSKTAQSAVEELNAILNGELTETISAWLTASGRELEALKKFVISRDNDREFEQRLSRLRNNMTYPAAPAQREEIEADFRAEESRLRQFKVIQLNQPESDLPFRLSVRQMFPAKADSSVIGLFQPASYGGGAEDWFLWLSGGERMRFHIGKLELDSGRMRYLLDFSSDHMMSNPRWAVSETFAAIWPHLQQKILICNFATGETQSHTLPFPNIHQAAILGDRLYVWFWNNIGLVEFELPSMKWTMISSMLSRNTANDPIAALSKPTAAIVFADPLRQRLLFHFSTACWSDGPENQSSFWQLDSATRNLRPLPGKTPSYLGHSVNWLSAGTILLSHAQELYRFDVSADRLSGLCRLVERSSSETAQRNAYLKKNFQLSFEYTLPKNLIPSNELDQKQILLLGKWLWGTAGRENLFYAVNLKDARIHYIALTEIKGKIFQIRALPGSTDTILVYTSAAVYELKIMPKPGSGIE